MAIARVLRHVDDVRSATTFPLFFPALALVLGGCAGSAPVPQVPVASPDAQHEEQAAQHEREEHEAEERRQREATARLDAREAREDQDWAAAQPQRCEDPIDPGACARLDAFLEKWPTGRYAGRAAAVRKRGAALIEARRDDYAWAATLSRECLFPKTSNGCAGIDRYLASFPGGPHAGEARRIRALSGKAIERLRREERATAARRAAARAAAEEEAEARGWTLGVVDGAVAPARGGVGAGQTRKGGTRGQAPAPGAKR